MKSLVIILFLMFVFTSAVAQQTLDEARILRNVDVVEMLKSGIGEALIIAKIKNSSTQFNTSTAALKELKEQGATDLVVLTMIEAKPKAQSLNTGQSPVELKTLAGKNLIYVESDDEEVRLLLMKEAKKQKFDVVTEAAQADLVFDMKVRTEAISYKPGALRGGLERATESRLCNLFVYLRTPEGRRIAFAKDIKSIYDDSSLAVLFGGGAVPGLKYQVPALLKSFTNELKKAVKSK